MLFFLPFNTEFILHFGDVSWVTITGSWAFTKLFFIAVGTAIGVRFRI